MHNMHVTVAVNPLVLCALRSMLLRCSGAFALLPALLGRFLPRLRPLALRAAFFLPEKMTAFFPENVFYCYRTSPIVGAPIQKDYRISFQSLHLVQCSVDYCGAATVRCRLPFLGVSSLDFGRLLRERPFS